MNFILILSIFVIDFNIVMTVCCKFIKRVIFIIDKNIWSINDWKIALLNRLNIVDWNFSKTIISDRDRKFLSKLWRAIFSKLDVLLLYFTIYHAQIDEQTKIFNQIVEIVLRFYLVIMKNSVNWSDVLLKMQRHINNNQFFVTFKTLNETVYDFILVQTLNF